MAEVIVGFVSAGVGIAAFAIQISKSIDALRQMRLRPGEARKDLTTLLERLQILHQTVTLLKACEGYQPVAGVIDHVQQRYGNIELTIRDLLEKHQEKGEGHGRHWKRVLTRHPKQQIKDLREKINDLIIVLNLAFMAAQCQPLSTQELEPRANSQAQEGGDQQAKHERVADGAKTCTDVAINSSSDSPQQHRILLSTAKTSSSCGARKSTCSCHQTGISGRFWFLQYTPLSSFTSKPNDRASGCSCINLRLRLALSLYGVPIAIVAGIGFMVDGSWFKLQLALEVERIVNYTSPGFETIWRLENGLISLPEARARFIELHQSDRSLRNHRDPGGNNYIQTLLQYPWIGRRQDNQFDLLRLLVTECEMTLAGETQSFLVQCAKWIGEGRHLALLDAILELGFKADAIHASPLEQWPDQCSPNWYGTGDTPDPFFIEYVGTILNYSPSYSGSTTLHNVLLNGSVDSAAYWLQRSQPLENNVNFLGQTPLHIVTTRPEMCLLVLDAGHDIDVTDEFGVTPLMYAAAMGQTRVAKLLISRGANLGLRDARLRWTFLDYAFFCDHWNLALDALLAIRSEFESFDFQLLVRCAIMSALSHSTASIEGSDFLPHFIRLSDDVNFTFEDDGVGDNNLMHYACNLEIASTLVQCGFDNFNQRNSEGKLAINSLAKWKNAPLIQFCIEKGTNVGNVSQTGHTIFFDILSGLNSFSWLTWDTVDSIKLCLTAGADPFTADDCMCPCSPDGCHVSSMFGLDFSPFAVFNHTAEPVWAFELLTLLEEHRGIQTAEQMLLSLLRKVRCDEPDISIAHVCCHRGRGLGQEAWQACLPGLQGEDIEEILDEEEDFIATLEMDMKQLVSFDFSKLRTELMVHLKGKYDAHIESATREREKFAAKSKHQRLMTYEVDYRTDEFKHTVCGPWPLEYSIVQSISAYAFWLQHERLRADKPLARDFHKAGWFERRICWLLEFMDVMEVTVEMLEESMGRISVTGTRTEKIDREQTVKSFLEAIGNARNKDEEREAE